MALPPPNDQRCAAILKTDIHPESGALEGTRCQSRPYRTGGLFCWVHEQASIRPTGPERDSAPPEDRRCTAQRPNGKRCAGYAYGAGGRVGQVLTIDRLCQFHLIQLAKDKAKCNG